MNGQVLKIQGGMAQIVQGWRPISQVESDKPWTIESIAERAGVAVSAWTFRPVELAVLAGVVALGALAGVIPAIRAYRTDIADGLSPTS